MANPIRKLVQLVLDKRAATKMEGQAKKSLGVVNQGFARLKKAALQLGATLAVAFGVRAIIRFGKESVRVAAEAEKIWNNLAVSVENAGQSFADLKPEIEAFAGAMQDATTVGDEEFAAILSELVQISGDYASSLRNVGLVADLATAKNIDFKIAAQLTGRAMIGETALLKRYGIVVQEGADAIEVMREQFRGFAEREGKTFAGRIGQLQDRMDDLKQAIGDVLILSAGGTSILEQLNLQVKTLTEQINANRAGVAEWARIFVLAVKAIGGTFTNIVRMAWNAGNTIGSLITFLAAKIEETVARVIDNVATSINQMIAGLNRLPGVDIQIHVNGRPVEELAANTRRALAGMKANTAEGAEALDNLVQNWVDLAVAIENAGKAGSVAPISKGGGVVAPAAPGEDAGAQDELTDAQKEAAQIALRLRTAQEKYNDTVARLRELLALLGEDFRETFARGMLEAGAAINAARIEAAEFGKDLDGAADGADSFGESLEEAAEKAKLLQGEIDLAAGAGRAAGDILAAGLGAGIPELAAAKAKQNAILAAEQFVEGLVLASNPITATLAPVHFTAAKMYAGIAAAWGALAGATGGFSGGGGGGSGSPRDTGGAASERTAPPGDEVHIYFVGPGFSAVNPEVQKVVYGAAQEAAAGFGPNTKVKYHRRPRG